MTDSISPLKAIATFKDDRKCLSDIRENIINRGKIKVRWTKAHIGNIKNERADDNVIIIDIS